MKVSSKISREVPLAELTLRKYERPQPGDIRELAKKVCLSLGLLSPGDHRDVIVDVFVVFLQSKEYLAAPDVERSVRQLRKSKGLTAEGTATSNIRRQMRRLKELYLIEGRNNAYRITEQLPLSVIWKDKIAPILLESTIARVQEYLTAIDCVRTL